MNTISVERLTHDDQPTIGVVRVNGRPLCFSLEDRFRQDKVAGDTRIWDGDYRLKWRTAGRWAKKFAGWGFPGSLELEGVRDFSDVLIHIGNTKGDTEGCILPGLGASFHTRTVAQSKMACHRLYATVAQGGEWRILVK